MLQSANQSLPREEDLPASVRAHGLLRLSVSRHPQHGLQRNVHEEGTSRLRFPRHHEGPLVAIMMNVAGGVAGGDRFSTEITAGEKVDLAVSTPSAERIYRSAGAAASVDIKLTIESGATLAWVPQETILFDGAKLDRRIMVDCSSQAKFILVEMMVLGRRESGEAFTTGEVRDHWNIRLDGRLVMAERLRLEPNVFDDRPHPARFGTTHAFATIVIVEAGGMEKLDQHRQLLSSCRLADVDAASTAYSGLIVIRMRASKAGALKAMVGQFLAGAFPAVLPRSF
jgi:urease accessory protein